MYSSRLQWANWVPFVKNVMQAIWMLLCSMLSVFQSALTWIPLKCFELFIASTQYDESFGMKRVCWADKEPICQSKTTKENGKSKEKRAISALLVGAVIASVIILAIKQSTGSQLAWHIVLTLFPLVFFLLLLFVQLNFKTINNTVFIGYIQRVHLT